MSLAGSVVSYAGFVPSNILKFDLPENFHNFSIRVARLVASSFLLAEIIIRVSCAQKVIQKVRTEQDR